MTSLEARLGMDKESPTFRAAVEHAKERYRNADIKRCANGCINYHDADTGDWFAGFGPAGCKECDD